MAVHMGLSETALVVKLDRKADCSELMAEEDNHPNFDRSLLAASRRMSRSVEIQREASGMLEP